MTHSEFVTKADAVCKELSAERINEMLELMFKDSLFWNLVKDFEGVEYFNKPYVGVRFGANPEPLDFDFGLLGVFEINCEEHTVQFSVERDNTCYIITVKDITDAAINDLYDIYMAYLSGAREDQLKAMCDGKYDLIKGDKKVA